jgi:hypothetical protein
MVRDYLQRRLDEITPEDFEWLKVWYVMSAESIHSLPISESDFVDEDMYKKYFILRYGMDAYKEEFSYGDEEEV